MSCAGALMSILFYALILYILAAITNSRVLFMVQIQLSSKCKHRVCLQLCNAVSRACCKAYIPHLRLCLCSWLYLVEKAINVCTTFPCCSLLLLCDTRMLSLSTAEDSNKTQCLQLDTCCISEAARVCDTSAPYLGQTALYP